MHIIHPLLKHTLIAGFLIFSFGASPLFAGKNFKDARGGNNRATIASQQILEKTRQSQRVNEERWSTQQALRQCANEYPHTVTPLIIRHFEAWLILQTLPHLLNPAV